MKAGGGDKKSGVPNLAPPIQKQKVRDTLAADAGGSGILPDKCIEMAGIK